MTKAYSVTAFAAALAAIFAAPSGFARWEKVDEATAVNLDQNMDFTVNKDGTYDYTYERTIEIRRDAARTSFGTVSFSYSAAASKLLAIKAETINGKKVIKVSKEHIEDKAERGADLGFDKVNRVSVAFPEVEVGSRLHYVYTLRTHTVPIAGQFSEMIDFGTETPDLPPSTVRFRSKAPLQIHVDDPEGYVSVDHHRAGASDVLVLKLLRPAYFKVVNEKDGGWFPRPPNPVVSVSTSSDWASIGTTLSPAYEAELHKPMPAMFSALADAAVKAHPGFIGRVNDFTAGLAGNVRYMGDWRTVKGGHVPRPLAAIAQTAFGDCKDLSLVTTAALRRMGYKANMALIYRGDAIPYDLPLPSVGAFNHAIVRAEDEAGHVHWVDPTNRVSRTQGIRVDIAGRIAVVVDGDHSRIERTPALVPADATTTRTSELDFRPDTEEAFAHHKIFLGASMAEGMTGLQLATNKEQIGEMLLRELAEGNEILSSQIAPFDLSSRVVRDLSFDVAFRSKWTLAETTAGHAYRLNGLFENLRKLDLTGRVSAYYLGHPEQVSKTDVLQNAELIGSATKPCSFSSKWLSGERRIEAAGDTVMITNNFQTTEYGISLDDLQKAEFKALQDNLKHCLGPYVVIFKKGTQDPKTLSH